MRIFIDVGAHYGETLHVALDPKWGFDRIFTLEPASLCLSMLGKFRNPRLVIEPVALSNRNGSATLHGAGLLGGSLYADKKQIADAAEVVTETITLVRASEWFEKNIPPGAEVYLKMNCEGGEADILEDLLDSGLIDKVTAVYVDFDIRKVPTQAHRQAGIERRLAQSGVRYLSTDMIGKGANAGTTEWLEQFCTPVDAPVLARLHHYLHFDAPAYERMKMVLSAVLPTKLYWWVGRRFGRMARQGSREGLHHDNHA